LRGIELTLIALLYAYVYLRFDLTTTIVAHLAYNATLTALPLLRSGQPYFVANGALVLVGLVVPIVPGAVQWLRRRLGGEAVAHVPVIQQATAQDVTRLAELDVGGADWARWVADPSMPVLCLCAQERIVGAAVGEVGPGEVGKVYTVFVAPEWRRRYWGSFLVQALGETLRARGVRSLQVKVPFEAWTLARFWDAQGWSPAATVYSRSLDAPRRGGVSALWARVREWTKGAWARRPRAR
jgi:hypothetical protein